MPHDATRADSPERWIEYARADMALAGAPLPEGARLEQLCFHAQQEAEKSLKAVLRYLGLEFPFTHSLQALATRRRLQKCHARCSPCANANQGKSSVAASGIKRREKVA